MRVFTDAARGDCCSGIGYYIEGIGTGRRILNGDYTSMEAEYHALNEGIRLASFEDRQWITIHTDCQPLVNKMTSQDPPDSDWHRRYNGCHWLLDKFGEWSLEWIPREENETANRQASLALEEGREKHKV